MSRVLGYATIVVTVLTFVQAAEAGLYPSEEKVPFPVRADGSADELTYGLAEPGLFNFQLARLAEVGKPTGEPGPKRKEALDRIARLRARPPQSLTPAETAGLAADLVRTRQTDTALNLLSPRTRDRLPDFRILATLAHVYALRGEWTEAVRVHEMALLDAEFPDELPGATPEQRKWLHRLEKDYYRTWLQIRRQESASRLPPEAEDVLPIFPVRFVNGAGVYEPGKLAAAERAKLPPDAVAIVQQLILWHPDDARLHWLLGELYAANGRLREAEKIFDDCAWDRQYTNRKVLMDHRSAVKQAVAALPPPTPADEPVLLGGPDPPRKSTLEALGLSEEKLYVVGAAFAALAVVMLGFQFRAIRRGLAGSGGSRG